MNNNAKSILVVLGPTASGKTRLGVRLAHQLGGEIISADSRQVYRGLDIGAGKDLDEYIFENERIAYHLIDVVDLDVEYSVFDFQKHCCDLFGLLWSKEVLPVLVGGTGLYLESVLLGYDMREVPKDPILRGELDNLSGEELVARLRRHKKHLHNITDIENRDRLIRAIEIAEKSEHYAVPNALSPKALVLGIHWPRDELRKRIRDRLVQRVQTGLIEEVEGLVAKGVSWDRLRSLGLEYRYVADRLCGIIKNRNDLIQKLFVAICKFSKRQETWFRRMEKKGVAIRWIEHGDFEAAIKIVEQESWVF